MASSTATMSLPGSPAAGDAAAGADAGASGIQKKVSEVSGALLNADMLRESVGWAGGNGGSTGVTSASASGAASGSGGGSSGGGSSSTSDDIARQLSHDVATRVVQRSFKLAQANRRRSSVGGELGSGALMFIQATVTDAAKFRAYAAQVPALVAAHGGRYVALRTAVQVLEGAPDTRKVVVSAWPSFGAARKFWASPEYQACKALRAGAAECQVTLVACNEAVWLAGKSDPVSAYKDPHC